MKRVLMIALMLFALLAGAQSSYGEEISLLQEQPENTRAADRLMIIMKSTAVNTEEGNYRIAKAYFLRDGGNPLSAEYITKAIEINPDNTEYRWIRVKCLASSKSTAEELQTAVDDLKYIINKGDTTYQAQAALDKLEQYIAWQ